MKAAGSILFLSITAVTTKYGVPGLKAALEITAGYGGRPRLPLLPLANLEYNTLAKILAATPLE